MSIKLQIDQIASGYTKDDESKERRKKHTTVVIIKNKIMCVRQYIKCVKWFCNAIGEKEMCERKSL